VCQEQLKYLQTQEFSNKKKPLLQALALAKQLRVKTHQNICDSNTMDVDARNFSCRGFTPLTDEEKQKLRDTGRCFRCQKDIFPSTALLGRIGMLSMGDQPPPRMPAVAKPKNQKQKKNSKTF
jgi:hypothetical protein